MVGSEPFDGVEFLVDFREGGAAVMWLASARHWGLRAPVFKMGKQRLVAKAAGGEGNNDCGGLHQAPDWPEPGVHRFLAASGVLHQQAQKLAVPLDDTHVRDTGFVAGGWRVPGPR